MNFHIISVRQYSEHSLLSSAKGISRLILQKTISTLQLIFHLLQMFQFKLQLPYNISHTKKLRHFNLFTVFQPAFFSVKNISMCSISVF